MRSGTPRISSGTHVGTLDLEQVDTKLEDGPFRTVGSPNAAPDAQFAYLAWATFGPDRTIVAVDRGFRTVKVFDTEGNHQRELGRLGDGPGEYRSPNWVGQCGPTTVTVFDFSLDRLTELTLSGHVVGTRTIPDRSGYVVDEVRCHPSGRYVITQRDVTTAPQGGGAYRVGFMLQTMVGLGGEIVDVGVVWGEDRYRYPSSDMPAPLGASLSFAVAADRVVLTSGAEPRAVEIDLVSGDTLRVIEWEPLADHVDGSLRRAVIDADLDLVRGRIRVVPTGS